MQKSAIFLATSRISPNCVIAGTPPTFPNSASVAKLKPETSQHKSSDLSMTRDLQEKERRLHKKTELEVLNLNRSSMIQSFSSEFWWNLFWMPISQCHQKVLEALARQLHSITICTEKIACRSHIACLTPPNLQKFQSVQTFRGISYNIVVVVFKETLKPLGLGRDKWSPFLSCNATVFSNGEEPMSIVNSATQLPMSANALRCGTAHASPLSTSVFSNSKNSFALAHRLRIVDCAWPQPEQIRSQLAGDMLHL